MAEDFFGNLSKTLKKTVESVGKKTDEFVEIQKIRSRQHSLEDQLEKNYQDIGQIIYSRFQNGEAMDENLAGLCKDISELEKEIAFCKDEVAGKKGQNICPVCGAGVPKDAAFCMRCGTPMPAAEETVEEPSGASETPAEEPAEEAEENKEPTEEKTKTAEEAVEAPEDGAASEETTAEEQGEETV